MALQLELNYVKEDLREDQLQEYRDFEKSHYLSPLRTVVIRRIILRLLESVACEDFYFFKLKISSEA